MKDNIPTGILIKTPTQFNLSVKTPPSEGPIAAANPQSSHDASYHTLFLFGTKLRPNGIATGTITAAEIPCIILKATNI